MEPIGFLKIVNPIRSIVCKLLCGIPIILHLRSFKEDLIEGKIEFEIESSVDNSLDDYVYLEANKPGIEEGVKPDGKRAPFVTKAKRISTRLKIISEDKLLQPYRAKVFTAEALNKRFFHLLFLQKYTFKSIRGINKRLYFRRHGIKMQPLRYYLELMKYRISKKSTNI